MSDQPGGGGASRSTTPASGTSAATDVSLREHLTALIEAAEKRSDQRFESMKAMVDTAFKDAQTAIDKADLATEKRFEGVNEFRAQLADQAAHFASREVLDSLAEKLVSEINRNREDLVALAKRLDLREGQTIGAKLSTGALVTVVTIGISVIGIIVVLANYVTNK